MFCGAKASSHLGLGHLWRQLWHPEFAPHSLHAAVALCMHGAGGAGGLGVISRLAQPAMAPLLTELVTVAPRVAPPVALPSKVVASDCN